MLALVAAPARAGHELSFYPSFYPHQIEIQSVDRAAAAALLSQAKLHAYIGADPYAGGAVPANVTRFESLGSYVVLTFSPASHAFGDRRVRCAAALRIEREAAAAKAGYVFAPYPVTPYHPDYVAHFDLAQASLESARSGPPIPSAHLPRLRARGTLAEAIVGNLASPRGPWDATVEEIGLDQLLASQSNPLEGLDGPPWQKHGWYHAYLLDRNLVRERPREAAADALYSRLTKGEASGARRVDLERRLVSTLAEGCERVVLGYRVRREYANSEYSEGVEDVAYDGQAGLNSPIFIRSVKLKDFPWNGWVRLGLETEPNAPWNPIAGFNDSFGRLLWSAVGDPAFIPMPHGSGWLPNRVNASVRRFVRVEVPSDALQPDPAGGPMRRIGPGKRAAVKVVYRVRASAFHDGTRMGAADALYPFAFAARWGAAAANSALLRERLVAVRVVKVETVVRVYSDVRFVYDVPIVEVYLNEGSGGDDDTAALAPPWSAVPWTVVALAEAAQRRGLASFTPRAGGGARQLDLVRDPRLGKALAALVDEFSARAYVPSALTTLVKPAEARRRWTALGRFHRRYGHFLVSNGPYRLKSWSSGHAVLEVFRDMTYPLGVGTFDEYAFPLKAYATKMTDRGDRLEFHADIERVNKFAREYEILREPMRSVPRGEHEHVPTARFVVVGPAGDVVRAGLSMPKAGLFSVDLSRLGKPGRYVVLVGVSLNGTLNPDVKLIEHAVEKPGKAREPRMRRTT